MSVGLSLPPSPPSEHRTARPRPQGRRATSLFAGGEPQVWLTGGALVLCLLMITGLLVLVVVKGSGTFWAGPVVGVETIAGKVLWGEVAADEEYRPEAHAFDVLPEERRAAARQAVAERGGTSRRRMLRTGNFELTGTHYTWVSDFEIDRESLPSDVLVIEREAWGRFYGVPRALLEGGPVGREARPDGTAHVVPAPPESFRPVAEGFEQAWAAFEERHAGARERRAARVRLEKDDTGAVNARIEESRLAVRRAELAIGDEALRSRVAPAVAEAVAHERWAAERERHAQAAARARAAGTETPAFAVPEPARAHPMPTLGEQGPWAGAVRDLEQRVREQRGAEAGAEAEFRAIRDRIEALDAENARHVLVVTTADGQEKRLALDEVVRAYPANALGWWGRLGVYASRWGEFLGDDPRESNSEGGVLPCIFGTVVMTLIMSLLVVPFGVLAALYLREYAKAGALVSLVRIAINNLAGVPSIVFGVFGLGFFCYLLGGRIDQLFFAERLPSPTFGTGGILWASLTLALLTLPVVIVATEEALSAVPRSMREGSYACGASQWQTIRRIVLPRAMPGIMTGMILALARGAGEVAPLMLVGVVKLAPKLPVDATPPFVHGERSFMHLGFHIYDVGFQSQNSEAAKPLVFTTTLLLIALVVLLNVVAIWIRSRLRRKFSAGQA